MAPAISCAVGSLARKIDTRSGIKKKKKKTNGRLTEIDLVHRLQLDAHRAARPYELRAEGVGEGHVVGVAGGHRIVRQAVLVQGAGDRVAERRVVEGGLLEGGETGNVAGRVGICEGGVGHRAGLVVSRRHHRGAQAGAQRRSYDRAGDGGCQVGRT